MKTLAALVAFIVVGFSATHALACACCGTYAVTGVANWDTLNVRSGPGTGYPVIARLPHNDSCITMSGDRHGDWARITANSSGATGWVNAHYLVYRDGSPAPGPVNVQYLACVVGVRYNDVLNIRAHPSASSPIMGAIPSNGDGVEVFQDTGSWSRVRFNGVTGWVASRFLDARC